SSVRTAAAPAAAAEAAKDPPWVFAPGSAAYRSPARTARESRVTPWTVVDEAPITRPAATWAQAATGEPAVTGCRLDTTAHYRRRQATGGTRHPGRAGRPSRAARPGRASAASPPPRSAGC